MNLYKSDKVRFTFGLIFIIIYSWNYLFLKENNSNVVLPKIIIHLIMFSTTIAVYFVGTIHLGKLEDTWMSTLWHLIHISGLFIITSLGLFDWFILEISKSLKHLAYTIQEILISPVLYVAMGLLNRSLKNNNHDT